MRLPLGIRPRPPAASGPGSPGDTMIFSARGYLPISASPVYGFAVPYRRPRIHPRQTRASHVLDFLLESPPRGQPGGPGSPSCPAGASSPPACPGRRGRTSELSRPAPTPDGPPRGGTPVPPPWPTGFRGDPAAFCPDSPSAPPLPKAPPLRWLKKRAGADIPASWRRRLFRRRGNPRRGAASDPAGGHGEASLRAVQAQPPRLRAGGGEGALRGRPGRGAAATGPGTRIAAGAGQERRAPGLRRLSPRLRGQAGGGRPRQ